MQNSSLHQLPGNKPLRAWYGRHTLIIDKTDENLAVWHTRLVAGR
jgi:hypothetical protein